MGMHFFDEKGIEKKDFMTKFSEIYESLDDERYKEYHNYIEQQKNKDFIENLKRRGIPLKFLEESIDTYKSESETEKIIKQLQKAQKKIK